MADDKSDALATTERAPIAIGMTPTSIDEAWRLANWLAKSELVPKHYRERPYEIIAAMQHGAELGLAPMQALQTIAVIGGRASVFGDGLLAILQRSPLYREHVEYFQVDGVRRDRLTADDLTKGTTAAVCTFLRRDKPDPVSRLFSIDQARRAHLWNKPGPWSEYPDRMLQMRARSYAARDAFADVLRGLATEEPTTPTMEEPAPLPVVRRLSTQAPELEHETIEPEAANHVDGFKSDPVAD